MMFGVSDMNYAIIKHTKSMLDMDDDKKYTIKELKDKLTEKEKIFCHEYIIDWNGTRAALKAGYSEKTARQIAYVNLTKAYIQQYIEYIKTDIEKEAGISKLKQIHEYYKIAYSSIAHLHETWITLKEFEELTDEQKASIESIESKTESKTTYNPETDKKENVIIRYVKIKLYSKIAALERIDKLMGYNEPEKHSHESPDGSMTPIIQLNYKGKDINFKE